MKSNYLNELKRIDLKKIAILIVLPILCFFQPKKNKSKIVSLDAKYTCKCLKIVDKKAQRLEKKVERQEKKSYKYGGRREPKFGGYSLDFNLDECRNEKRNKKVKNYIESLDEDEKSKFDRKVLKAAKRRCPDVYKRVTG